MVHDDGQQPTWTTKVLWNVNFNWELHSRRSGRNKESKRGGCESRGKGTNGGGLWAVIVGSILNKDVCGSTRK